MARSAEYTDNFNRSDENLETSSNWDKISGQAAVSSNVVAVSSTVMEYIWNTANSDADCYASVKIPTAAGSYGLNVRCDNDFSEGYHIQFRQASSDILVYRRVGGGYTSLGTLATGVTLSNNDVIAVEITGTGATVTIEAFVNDVSKGTIEDTNAARIVVAGRAGLRTNSTSTVFDDFESGIFSTNLITLTDVDDGKIVQRNSDEEGSLVIAGTYTGSPTSIEARVVDDGTSDEVVTWTEIDVSPSGGSFSGTLTGIPQGGWYNVQVRYSNETGITDEGVNAFGVGILIGCIGQSNIEKWFTDGTDLTANDLLRSYAGSWAVPTKNGAISFGNTIISDLGIPVGLLDYGVGGSALNSAADTGNGYWLDTATAGKPYVVFEAAVTALGGVLECVVWYQGERDANAGISEAQYESDLATLVSNLRTDISSPSGTLKMLLVQIARYTAGTDSQWQAIRQAQRDFVASDANVYLAATTIDSGLQGDGIHLDTTGLTENGSRVAQCFLYLFSDATYYLGPTITSFEKISATVIDVTITHSGGTDFTPTSAITGFIVTDDGSPETISTAVRQNATTIRLTIDGSLDGTLAVSYQYGANPTVTGAVLDNTAVALPLQMNEDITEVFTLKTHKIIGGGII